MVAAAGVQSCSAIVKTATDPRFGDYQVNGIMALAKQLRTNPRKLAEDVAKNLDIADICRPAEIAGPGFINLRLKPEAVAKALLKINEDVKGRLGIEKTARPKTIVVDFSGPNIAKQMHVGHLRSTILGDSICRTLEFLGHNVIRQNHIGDWGLQMGMVAYSLYQYAFDKVPRDAFAGLKWAENLGTVSLNTLEQVFEEFPDGNLDDFVAVDLDTLEAHYKEISNLEKKDTSIAEEVRKFTVNLQTGQHIFTKRLWEKARSITLEECYKLYQCLNVTLDRSHTKGESEYKDDIPDVIDALRKAGYTRVSDGAVCVFPEGFRNKKGQSLPFIIQKSDGAYLYATTDLAALRYRVKQLKADSIIYVTDARQKLHFEMLFAVAGMAGWADENIELSHVTFGSVLGEKGQPLKTRSGENVKLKDLLDEALERAKGVVEEKNPDLPPDQKDRIAEAVGIGAVKYADYSNNRTSDYIFSFDKMLAMDGNTAPYMQYAYARIKSIERKARTKPKAVDIATELAGITELDLTEPAELDLGKHLIRYIQAIRSAAVEYRPNYLTNYLYELAQKFSVFYTNCPVLDAPAEKRPTRLLLCHLTANTIKNGLSRLLGIEVVEQM